MKHLLIIGARGYGRGTYDIARMTKGYGVDFDVKGFLDDKSDALEGYPNYPPILSSVEDYIIKTDDVFVCALGDVKYKEKYVKLILDKGGTFYTLIHSSCHIGTNVHIGKGCIVGYGTQIDSDAFIGDFVNVQTNAVIGHDSKIGNWTMVDCFAFTGGHAIVGERVTIHTGALILPNKKLGDNSVINAGSVVIRDVKEDATVMGNPAKELIFPKIEK